MSDIISGDTLTLVAGAVGTLLGAAWLASRGGKLGDEARHLSPPGKGAQTVGGLAISTDGAEKIAGALHRIADLLERMEDSTQAFRSQRMAETLEEVKDGFKALLEREAGRRTPHR